MCGFGLPPRAVDPVSSILYPSAWEELENGSLHLGSYKEHLAVP